MTPAQESARMTKILDGIWRKGDQDECSIKHVSHGLAAIITGGTWEDAIDYKRPWPEGEGRKSWETDLAKRWAKVQATYDRLGHDEFMDAVDSGPYGAYVQDYVEMYYATSAQPVASLRLPSESLLAFGRSAARQRAGRCA